MSELKENTQDTTEAVEVSATAPLQGADTIGSTAESIVDATDVLPTKPLSLGQTLRAAREAAQLSIEDVAQSLKFSPRQVELLEADDYAALPGNTIVRGFTRSYARLLKIDAETLLQLLDAITPNAPGEVRPPDNMGNASDPKGLQQMSLLMAAAIVISLAAALLALWHFLKPEPVKPTPAAEASRVHEPVAEAPPAVLPGAAPFQPAGASQSQAQSEAVANATNTTNTTNTPNSGAALLFEFKDKSWLEVTDAAKQVVHSGENPAGSKLSLNGKPPFDIVIGNAGKVKLSYGEREIDLAPYTRAEVARLKVE